MAGLKLSNVKSWKTALLISIIIPTSLLTAFTLNNLLNKPITITETTTLEATEWQIERPTYITNIWEVTNASHKSDEILVNSTIFVDDFDDDYGGGFQSLMTCLNVTASLKKGFIYNLNITFWENYEKSLIDLYQPQEETRNYELGNLTIEGWAYGLDRWWLLRGNLKCFITLKAVNHPRKIQFSMPAEWAFKSPENQTHKLEIFIEVTYFNGTTYKRLIQPYQLKIGPDSNNSFETATELSKNQTLKKLYIGGYDKNDYYKIYLEKDHSVQIYLEEETSSLAIANINISVYDPNGIEKAYKTLYPGPGPRYTNLTLITDKTGYWYIRVELGGGQCFYTLKINTTK